MSRKDNKKQGTAHNRIGTKKGKRAKIMEYIKQLITLASLLEIIIHNLEKEVEKGD